MNSKMAKNTNLSTIESKKNKLRKQEEQRQNHGYRECFHAYQMGGGCEGMGKEMRGLNCINRQLQNSHGDVKYSIGNGEAKELTRMTHGHEQSRGDCLREWRVLGGKGQKDKNQDNCNSIINKI